MLDLNKKLIIKNQKQKNLKLRSDITSEEDKKKAFKSRKIIKQIVPSNSNVYQITGYIISESIVLEKINKKYEDWSYTLKEECVFYFRDKKYVFIFDFGVVIFWNIGDLEIKDFLQKINNVLVKKYTPNECEKDIMFYYPEFFDFSKIEDNVIYLISDNIDEKFTHSYALGQSLKLEIFENQIENNFKNANEIPEILSKKGEINLSKKEVYKMIGNLFMLRNKINFINGIVDTPEYFWNNEQLEKTFNIAKDYYDINERLEILNDRLNLIKELYELLNEDLHNKHTTKLEIIVMFLILIEVGIEVVWNILIKDVFKLF